MPFSEQLVWEQIFGFRNPLQQPGDSVNPIEDGKEFRRQWFALSQRILVLLKKRLASTYNSSIPSATYDNFMRGWAEEIARTWIESDRIRSDRYLTSTRGQYLYQKWGVVLHVNSSSYPRETQTTEIYRTFLQHLLETYLGGSRKDVIQDGVSALVDLPADLVELVRLPGLDISYQFMFDVTVHVTDLNKVLDYVNLLTDVTYLLEVVRPAHTIFKVRVILDEPFNVGAGCITDMGTGYLLADILQRQPFRMRVFQGLVERTLEGEVSELDIVHGTMKMDGIAVRFNPAKVKVLLEGAVPGQLSQLKNGDVLMAEGWPIDIPITVDGFYSKEKIIPTSLCDLDRMIYVEWNYDDIRKCYCPYSRQSFRTEHLPATLTSYGSAVIKSPHVPLSRGGNSALPPTVKPDGSGGIRVWYLAPDKPAVNVTGKIIMLYPDTGEIDIQLEPGVTSPQQVQDRYLVEYYIYSPEIWVDREVIQLNQQTLPFIRLRHGPVVYGNGKSQLYHFIGSDPGDLRMVVNGVDETRRIKTVDPLLGQLELYSDWAPEPQDLVEVSYWYWQGLAVPLLTNTVSRVLNDQVGGVAHRFAYQTVLLNNLPQPPSVPVGDIVTETYSCPQAPKEEVQYCAVDMRYSSLLNRPDTLRTNRFGGLYYRNKLNRYTMFCSPPTLGQPVPPFEYVGPRPRSPALDPLLEDPTRRRTVISPDTPIIMPSKPWYEYLTFYNKTVVEGDCFPRPFRDDEAFRIKFRFSEDSYLGTFEDPDLIHTNSWGHYGYYFVGYAYQRCCYIDYGKAAAFNVLASRLNQAQSVLNPDCTPPAIPIFALIYNKRSLWRYGLNSRDVVLYSFAKRGWFLQLQDFVEEDPIPLPIDEWRDMSVGLFSEDSFGSYLDVPRAFIGTTPVPV